MARFRNNDHVGLTSPIFACDGLRIERTQRFDQAALLTEMVDWPAWRMRITLGGTRYLTYEEQRHMLSPNTVCWCGPLRKPVRASWLPGTGSDIVDVSWSAKQWRLFCEEHPHFARQNAALLGENRQPRFALLPAPPQLLHVLQKALTLAQKRNAPAYALENHCRLLLDLLAALQFTQPRQIDEAQRQRVAQAQAIMVAHLGVPLHITQIAAQLNISPRQLQRDFSVCTGLTPIRYFNLMRLSEANFLLAETSLPVAEIAETLGYVSVTHFSTAFRQVYHCSPREVRRQNTTW